MGLDIKKWTKLLSLNNHCYGNHYFFSDFNFLQHSFQPLLLLKTDMTSMMINEKLKFTF